jgi:hypothetical protein
MTRPNGRQLPLKFLLATFAGWVNRQQTDITTYLVEENRGLKEQPGKKRLRLTPTAQTRSDCQAARSAATGSRRHNVTPDTILRWHRKLIAAPGVGQTPDWTLAVFDGL